MPKPLPKTLLADLLRYHRLLLCLDYDGTLATTTRDPGDAEPLPGARDVIGALSRHPNDVVVAIVSGRDAQTARRMLGLYNHIYYVGLHGIELLDPSDRRHLLTPVRHCLDALDKVRQWLARSARPSEGFVVEDKELSIALHYRNAHPYAARDMCRDLEYFVTHLVKGLRVSYGDMAAEVIPSNTAGKGFAVAHILGELRDPHLAPVYFGNDPSDEEAFFAVRREHGTTILVGPERDTRAEYRADSPADVVEALSILADEVVET
jgi:trehalose-phosphatase